MRTATLACIILPFRTSHKYGFTHLTRYPKQDRVGQNITPSMPFKWESSRKVASLAAAVAVSLLGRPKQLQWQSHCSAGQKNNFPAVHYRSAGHQAVHKAIQKTLSKTVATRWETSFVSDCWLAFMLLPQNKVTPQHRYMDIVQQEVHICLRV